MDSKKSELQRASLIIVDEQYVGRRLDNFLIKHLGRLPKSRIYKMIRKGEVRVNHGRKRQSYRLQENDRVRIPPFYYTLNGNDSISSSDLSLSSELLSLVSKNIIYEDEYLIVINKPANISVHSGAGLCYGIIEILRAQRPDELFLELVHRLDRATSGCLLIAKQYKILRYFHNLFKNGGIKKNYLALLKGYLDTSKTVNLPLRRSSGSTARAKIKIDNTGKNASTRFDLLEYFHGVSLARIELITGKTHQIRVHASAIGHPLAGDKKYGDWEFNSIMRKLGLKRLFLHAQTLSFKMPVTEELIQFMAPLPSELKQHLNTLAKL